MATQQIKDILDTDIPKPSFVLSPSVPAPLPSGVTVTRNGGDNVARTLDPYSGKFEHVPEDTPRVYGADQSLLVEASRTNYVLYSSAINTTNWSSSDIAESAVNSLIDGDGETAYELSSQNSNVGFVRNGAGTATSSEEVAMFIAEAGVGNAASASRFGVGDGTDSGDIAEAEYDWVNDTSSLVGNTSEIEVNHRRKTNGPNGKDFISLVLRYDPSLDSRGGNTRRPRIIPDVDGNDNAIIAHHAQLEEASRASSPIVTSGSAKTRAGDEYTIFDYSNDPDQDYPEWWNPNEGTFFVRFRARTQTLDVGDNDMLLLAHSGANQGLRARNGYSGQNTYRVQDSSGNSVSAGTINEFEVDDVALSLTDSEFRLSVNGSSASGNANGNFVSTSQLNIGSLSLSRLIGEIHSLRYIPRALSESTLNVLTT